MKSLSIFKLEKRVIWSMCGVGTGTFVDNFLRIARY
jgi:hypothetical protein